MAELRNDSGALRLSLSLVASDAARGVLIGSAGLEVLDRRDAEWWPIVRLPALHFPASAVERLLAGVSDLVRGNATGLSWRPEDDAAVAVQLGAVEGGAVVEVGIDLGVYLAEVAGAPRRPEAELALFRFRAGQGDLVRFSDALAGELEALRR